jgi:RimJ/RimL family protein N-acetyltransferase
MKMIYHETINGQVVDLRSVNEDDAEFILSLRLDPHFNKYLNKVENDVDKQRQWIINQQQRENDYYFLVLEKNGNPIGTISLYNINNSQGEFGRWIVSGNSLQALESVILIHDFGFNILNLELIYSLTVTQNIKVLNFHKNFGATVTDEKTTHPIGNFVLQKAFIKKDEYNEIRERNIKMLMSFL